jgi:hypothetical protein
VFTQPVVASAELAAMRQAEVITALDIKRHLAIPDMFEFLPEVSRTTERLAGLFRCGADFF